MTACEFEQLSKAELIAIILRIERRLHELEVEVAALRKRNAELEAQVSRLRENSSKPPSSDLVKPPKPPVAPGKKWHIGGQPGHPLHVREPFGPEELDDTRPYRLDCCPDRGGKVKSSRLEDRVVQQVEILERPVEIIEYQWLNIKVDENRRRIH